MTVKEWSIMAMRYLVLCLLLGGFVPATLSFYPEQAEAAQTAAKKKTKKADQKKQQQPQQGKKKYPWGEPNAGWSDTCIFYFDTYDGWIPPKCRPHGRTY